MVPVVAASAAYTRIEPTSPGKYSVQLTISRETHDLLREAQALLGHAVPSGDIEAVLQRALGELVHQLRKQKFAETERPRAQRESTNARHIPAEVQRAVRKRDGDRCTFVSDTGKRCDEATRLEWDHVIPVARGGTSTEANLRLLCRTHNQYAAEQVYGQEFVQGKRERAADHAALHGARH
jgi:5-methylcytosine-specific restriction endonuclease McrA